MVSVQTRLAARVAARVVVAVVAAMDVLSTTAVVARVTAVAARVMVVEARVTVVEVRVVMAEARVVMAEAAPLNNHRRATRCSQGPQLCFRYYAHCSSSKVCRLSVKNNHVAKPQSRFGLLLYLDQRLQRLCTLSK